MRASYSEGVHAFRGIPSSADPVDELRFRAPVLRAPWTGVRDVQQYAASFPLDSRPTLVFDVESHVVKGPSAVELRAWPA